MIKSFTPQPYKGDNPLPTYVSNARVFTGTAPGGYIVTLARLTVGQSVSAGNLLSHALFESFTDHGERRKVARTRVCGYDSEFVAARNAMMETGVEFHPMIPCTCDDLMNQLGDWLVVSNPELSRPSLMSQSCH